MKKVVLNQFEYELIKNYGDCFRLEDIEEKVTDYFIEFDYIFGDYAYDKVRLKGFYDKTNKKMTSINNIDDLDHYIKNYCAYGSKYFLLKKSK